MRLAWMAAILAIAAAASHAQPHPNGRMRDVTVYVRDEERIPPPVLAIGEGTASQIFRGIGIRLSWRHYAPRPDSAWDERVMFLVYTTECQRLKGDAAAAAFPYEGTTIVVCYDRLRWAESHGTLAARLLACVLAHEIAHNLEGVARHSDTGIMKARWTNRDYAEMMRRPLSFEPLDVELILRGLDAPRRL